MLLNKNKHKFKKQPSSKPAKEFWFPLSYHCPGRSSPRGFKAIFPPGLWVAELSVQSCLTSVSSPVSLVSPVNTSRGLWWLPLIRQCLMNREVLCVEGCQASWDHSACWPIPMAPLVQIVKTIMFLSFPRAAWWTFLTQINSLIRKVFFVSTTLRVHTGTTWEGFVGFLFFALNDHWLFECKWPSINFFCFYAAILGISQQFNNE